MTNPMRNDPRWPVRHDDVLEPSFDESVRFARGVLVAVPLSAVMWIVIIWAVRGLWL